ncbi:hypothetical protein ACOMHN_005334 [Nucella lapillus]
MLETGTEMRLFKFTDLDKGEVEVEAWSGGWEEWLSREGGHSAQEEGEGPAERVLQSTGGWLAVRKAGGGAVLENRGCPQTTEIFLCFPDLLCMTGVEAEGVQFPVPSDVVSLRGPVLMPETGTTSAVRSCSVHFDCGKWVPRSSLVEASIHVNTHEWDHGNSEGRRGVMMRRCQHSGLVKMMTGTSKFATRAGVNGGL